MRYSTAAASDLTYTVFCDEPDNHSRLAYSEALDDERADTCAAFLARALAFFAAHGIVVQRVMTDNALAYRHGNAWKALLAGRGIRQIFIKPHCPWTNGALRT